MNKLLTIAERLDAIVDGIGRLAAWLLPVLVVLTVFDVVTRRYFFGSSAAVQEMEWHLHTAIFALCLGYGYLRNAHVRIEILRERMLSRGRAVVELLGCLFLLLPYMAVLIYFGVDFVASSYAMGEGSSSPAGLPHRWVIKGVLLLGIVLMLLAGISTALRQVLVLFASSADLRARAGEGKG